MLRQVLIYLRKLIHVGNILIAVREAIRNAVVHRDYALTGRDIKVAVFDDMIEITSPGKLLPSIDFAALEARQSDIRNKTIAPLFKRVGLIDQWVMD
ncbi:ATP-binding protein [Sphingobacterium gobiense]|uniref:ATP-binding protein n=1 Tax=Sphingobacterium gobiense TaxID=1382456 RepID=UPI001C6140A7|nr:ATP-binding protein [Sphingobacterium gobiense]